MTLRWCVILLVLSASCAPSESSPPKMLGRAHASPAGASLPPSSSPIYSEFGLQPSRYRIHIRLGVESLPPPWLGVGDEQPFADAVNEYIDDFEQRSGWKIPPPLNSWARPFVILFDDWGSPDEYSSHAKTAWLGWRAGVGGNPVSVGFAPELHACLVSFWRVETGRVYTAWTAQDFTIAYAGRTLPVRFLTKYPWLCKG